MDPEQRQEFQNFASHCGSTMFLFDIGAHFGVFSLAAAQLDGKAIAVDPSPTATRMIARQSALNGCTDKIQIVQAAVSDADGVMGLLGAGAYSYGYFRVAKGRSKRELKQVAAVTIDHLAREFGAPSHIKIDVEGHEAAALRGARATLSESSPLLFLELHTEMILAEGGDPSAALDELSHLGYATFGLDGAEIPRKTALEKALVRIVARRMCR
jgi:FkbM family methyltransferase